MPDKTDKDLQGGLAQFARNSSRGMAPALGSPNMQAIANKIRANLTPPESVMDPRYAPWKKNLDDAEAFTTAADLALSAAPFVGPAVTLGRKAASSAARQAGEALNTRVLSGQPLIPGLPGFVAPNPLAFVIKPKGGNWVDSPSRTMSDDLGSLKYNMDAFPEEAAIDKWINTKLERYIKNEMASPDDPVRAYLEAFPARKQAMLDDKQRQIDKAVADMERARDARGVSPEMLTRSQERIRDLEKEKALIEERQGLHYTPRQHLELLDGSMAAKRVQAGFPREGVATGRQAKAWERDSDDAIASRSAGQFIASNPTQYEIKGRNPNNAWNTTKSSMDDVEAELEALRAAREKLDTHYAPNSPIAAGLRESLDDILSTPNPTLSGPLVDNPFIAKLPLQTPLYRLQRIVGRFGNDSLGFSHLTDELRNALRAGEEGLPESLALRPKDLDKMTVPQVIEHVDKINAWRAAQKNEINAAIANNPATVPHKEYATIPGTDLPNTRGLRWVEIKQPKSATVGEYADPMYDIPQEQQDIFRAQATREATRRGLDDESDEFMMAVQDRVHDLSQDWARINKPMNKELQDALRHEGEQMAHCVGGYCQDVMSGRSRIFSLRDAKHKSYTTIEVKPTQHLDYNKWFGNQPEEIRNKIAQRRIEDKNHDIYEGPEYLAARAELPQTVTQVKAYRDRKPDDEYIPFVQDFIRSNKFPITGDRPNTDLVSKSGLVKVSPDGSIVPEFTPAQLEALGDSEYLTLSELQKLRATPAAQPVDDATDLLPPAAGMKKGGPASQDAMQMQVWDKALRRQIGGASEPTQAEIEAAMRPETVSPRLRALANRVKTQPGVPITDRLVGAGEAATSLASGILGSVPAGYEGMAELLRSRDPARAAQAVETGLQRYTYQPRTATGMQEAQAGAHLLEKLDAPSQYVGNYMLEQTGSPAAATAAQIILDPLNFLPGPKQLASTVRGVPQMLQDAAIQAYGPGATASHVVPPQGNLNLTPHASAELLKGPDRQPVGNFLKQLQGTPGVTKEGLEEGLAATRVLDPTSVVTKAEFEKYATPSKYEKFEIEHDAANSEYHHELFEQAIEDVHDEFQNMPAFDYLGYEMGIPPRYAEDFNTLVQQSNMPHFADATSLSELEAYGISRELITLLERNDITTPEAFDRAIDYHTRQAINEQAEVRVEMHLAEQDEPTDYNTRQRLVTEDSRAALPFTAYQEIGVRHPNQQDDYKHFPGQQNMVGHFRGTMVPADWRRGVELENGAGTIPPGAFLIEELQSDAQQSGDTTKHLHQVHGVVAKAAIQHALEQGAHTVYVPTSSAIIDVREGLDNNDKNTLRRVYDKEVPSQAIEPLRKIPGVTITTTNPTASTNPKDRKFLFHVITFTDAAREHILRGLGQRTPGYAKGGPVSRDAMQMQVWDKALQRQTGGASEPTQAEIEAAMRPETISPHIRAFSNKLKANVTPPESVMDPRYAPWKKNLDQAEAFTTAADIVLSAAPLVGPALSLGRKAATSIGRQAGEALNTRILSGQGMVPGMPDMFAPNPLAFVVKPKGGNMLPDAVEAATAGLRRPVPSRATDNYGNEVPNPLANTDTAIENMALNNFIDTKINRYIKNEMATPEDPVRALAERGILHFEPNIADAPWLYENPAALARRRAAAGYPKEGLAQTPLGQSWETLTDQSLKSRPVSSIIASLEKRKLPVPDWMAKLEPTTPFYDPEIYNDALGLTHVMDELRNAMNPLAGLPRELMLKPETLSKLTLPQAIERVADINAWRLKQSETAMIADTLKADVHKEYRDTGTSWVKLNKPGQFAAESDAMGHSVRGYEPPKNGGDPSYGHGGWNAIKSGRAEVYSLRDAKKQPQVTIEVLRNNIDPLVNLDDPYDIMDAVYNKAPASKHAAFTRWIEAHADDHDLTWRILASPWAKYLPQTKDARLSITQIKGKGNGQPKPEYLPMIQDFIRSGQWDDIRDLRNAGLQQLPDKRLLTLEEFNAGLARLKKSRTVSTNDKNYASDAAGFNYRVADDASFWDRVKHFWDTPAEPVKTVKPIKRAKGGPISRDAMWMAVQDKQLRKKHGN